MNKPLVKTLKRKRSVMIVGEAQSHTLLGGTVTDIRPVPAYNVNVAYWFDNPTETFNARIVWTETRMGKQYGGAVVTEIKFKGTNWRSAHAKFMAKIRKQITKDINTYWT